MHQNNYQTKMKGISSTCLADDPCFNLAKWNVLSIHSLICSAPLPYTTPCDTRPEHLLLLYPLYYQLRYPILIFLISKYAWRLKFYPGEFIIVRIPSVGQKLYWNAGLKGIFCPEVTVFGKKPK